LFASIKIVWRAFAFLTTCPGVYGLPFKKPERQYFRQGAKKRSLRLFAAGPQPTQEAAKAHNV